MQRPINKFLVKILLFVVPVFMVFEALFRLGFAPIITDSTLFDLKMLTVQKQHIRDVKLMSIGSSVGLFELDSRIIKQNINAPYYNFSSWNLQITDTKLLLNSFVEKYHPKYVLLCSSIGDFISPPNSTYINYVNANDAIKDEFPEAFYFKNYNSIHQLVWRKYHTYPLKLDAYGAGSLTAKGINKDKWNEHDIFPTKYTLSNYKALDSVALFLKQQNVKLIFAQAPIRASYANTAISRQLLQSHFDKCRAIVEGNGGLYLNYYNPVVFTDSFFTDQYHLLNTGAVILTKEIVADLKGIVK